MTRIAKPGPVAGILPDLDCACATVRRAARLITVLYARHLGPHVEPSQYALLAVLSQRPGRSQSTLGRALGLDKTTLSRNLLLMQRNGWIEPAKAEDQRQRGYQLTVSGKLQFTAAKPGWKRAQDKLRAAMTDAEWENMFKVFSLVAGAARQAAAPSQIHPPKNPGHRSR